MKILQCHNIYQQPGGEDRVFADEAEMLRSHGHDVVQYTKHNDAVNGMSRIGLAIGTIWNSRAAKELKQLVRAERPDVVHFHNTLPLISPAGYYAARSSGAAIVQTLHNYRLTCPNATLFRDGKVCEDCVGRLFALPAIQHRCYRNNRAASVAVATMLTVHRLAGTYSRVVDRYIACSQFSKSKMTEAGLPEERISVKPNFIVNDPGVGRERGDYAMFLGRLSHEKGIETLLGAWPLVPAHCRLKLVGNGPMDVRVRETAGKCPHLEWLPGKTDEEVRELMRAAKFLILPSVNYEGFPKTIVESLSVGTPVVASNLGAMAELLDDGRTGRLFRPGDSADLAAVIEKLYRDETLLGGMRQNARREFEDKYTAARNYDVLMEIYDDAIERRNSTRKVTTRQEGTRNQNPELLKTV